MQQQEYLDTLDKKALRLKVLIEDLFEISKATTNNVTLHYDLSLIHISGTLTVSRQSSSDGGSSSGGSGGGGGSSSGGSGNNDNTNQPKEKPQAPVTGESKPIQPDKRCV